MGFHSHIYLGMMGHVQVEEFMNVGLVIITCTVKGSCKTAEQQSLSCHSAT